MQGISCFINFNENLSKNAPYYNLLIRKIDLSDSDVSARNLWIGEHAALSSGTCGDIVTKISEGYQFTIAFRGTLSEPDSVKKELSPFGYHILSDKDAELALLCYIHFGEKCSEKLSGSFSFIIYDAMRRQVFAFSDKNTEYPLFYGKSNEGYVISSCLKGVFACPGIQKKLTKESVLDFVCAQNRTPHRIFEDVYVLPQKHSLKISVNGISEKECAVSPEAYEWQPKAFFNKGYGIISSQPVLDMAILDKILKNRHQNQERISLYTDKISEDILKAPVMLRNYSIDDGDVFYGLESSVSASGLPILSCCDYILPIAIRRAKGNDETLLFPAPDRFAPYKNYLSTLIKNNAIYPPLEKNFTTHEKSESTPVCYPTLIADHFDVKLESSVFSAKGHCNKEETQIRLYHSPVVKTALRHILLDIISKEHSPIIAFFRRSALLRLCEGSFSFLPDQSDCELMAYLIKLNMWFEQYRPRII